jgi:hypothetical protein
VMLGTNAMLRLRRLAGLTAASPSDCTNGAYDLDGDGRNDVLGGAFLVEAVIPQVREPDARALNDRLDGPRLGTGRGQSDSLGRVIYPKPATDGRTEVHIYILHK